MNRSGTFIKPAMWTMALLAATVVAGCGGGGDGGSAPAKPAATTPTGACSGGTSCVALGTAANYAILAQSGVSTVPTSAVTGDVGLNAAATGLTGFSETLPAGGASSTSTQVTGKLFASDYAAPTPANLTTATTDASAAYTDASTTKVTTFPVNPTAGVIPAPSNAPVAPGVYKWTGDVAMTDTTLAGGADDVWVFQVAGNLTQAANTTVTLNGAKAKNVFWAVGGTATLGAGAHLEGTVLAQTNITLQTGASVNGRLISGTAVNLDKGIVIQP